VIFGVGWQKIPGAAAEIAGWPLSGKPWFSERIGGGDGKGMRAKFYAIYAFYDL
jgi:hypothetical protein